MPAAEYFYFDNCSPGALKHSHNGLVTYFFAGNAKRRFLVRRTKSALDEPASYEIIPGKLRISNLSLKVQEDHLRKQVNAEKEIPLPLKRKMPRFIQAVREEIWI